jgi:sulfotransferase famil protein
MPVLKILPKPYRLAVRKHVRRLTNTNPLHGHLAIETAPRVGYCYIRKNACSVFTRLILDLAPGLRPEGEKALRFMTRHHRLDYAGIADCAHVVFVIRDPFERLVSGFVQQVVNRALGPYPELEGSVRALTGKTRAELSFADFVEGYLGSEDFARINVHFTPQVAHLAPIRYTAVLHDRSLAADAVHVFGPAIAGRYFQKPVNATGQIARHRDPDAAVMPAGELRRRLDATGSLPDRADLLTPPLAAQLARIYAADVALFARYQALRAADPDRPPALDMAGHDFTVHFSLNRPRR